MAYDYTPVPDYVAPTQGNMHQAATEIANWLRTKGYGVDVRESLAQAVELFGDVASQFINQSQGMKGQFNSAISNLTSDTEIQAARTSTVSGTGYTTLGARLDALDTLTGNVSNDHTQLNTNTENLTGLSADLAQLQTNVNAGLPTTVSGLSTDSITFKNGVSALGGGIKIINFKSFKIIYLQIGLTGISGLAAGTELFTFNDVKFANTFNTLEHIADDTAQISFHSDGSVYTIHSITQTNAGQAGYTLDINRILIVDA